MTRKPIVPSPELLASFAEAEQRLREQPPEVKKAAPAPKGQRVALRAMDEQRRTFRGVFVRYGIKRGWRGAHERTVLLRDISLPDGEIVTDHLWFNLTQGLALADLQPGDVVEFVARVVDYRKGYDKRRRDWHLARPTQVHKLNSG
jgi:hypothetical protein